MAFENAAAEQYYSQHDSFVIQNEQLRNAPTAPTARAGRSGCC